MLYEVYYEKNKQNPQGLHRLEERVLPYMVLERDEKKREAFKSMLQAEGFECVAWNEDYPAVLVNLTFKKFGLIYRACNHSCVSSKAFSIDEFINGVLAEYENGVKAEDRPD